MSDQKVNAGAIRRKGAADLCRTFMENEGWAQLFSIARGDPQPATVRSRLSGKAAKVNITPEVEVRLTAYRLICSYGYGRPAELTDTDTGRTLTDVLLESLRASKDVAR